MTPAKFSNILIIKPSALGDIIHTTAILPIIKNYNSQIKISWLVFEHNQDLLVDHPLIDQLFVVSRHHLFSKKTVALIKKLRQNNFDLVVDLQGLFRSAVLSWLSNCKRRVGFTDNREMSAIFYNEAYNIPTASMHAVNRYLLLLNKLGLPLPSSQQEIEFPLPIKNQHRDRIKKILDNYFDSFGNQYNSPSSEKRSPIITICPTTKWQSKCWPAAYFIELAKTLQKQLGAKIILVGAPNEVELINKISLAINTSSITLNNHQTIDHAQKPNQTINAVNCASIPCLNLTGQLHLMEIAALLHESDLFIGNDSGLMHLAAATKTPSVVVFGPTAPHKTGPYSKLASIVRTKTNLNCMPCFRKKCLHQQCMRLVNPSEVAAICLDKLNR